MEKRWIVKQGADFEKVAELAKDLKISKSLASLLMLRNVRNRSEATAFFMPQLSQLHNPFLMKDMDKAVERIGRAFEKKEKMLIFGDYDVDGTSAVALMYSFLEKHFSKKTLLWNEKISEHEHPMLDAVRSRIERQFVKIENIEYYVPDRYNEGYGISNQAVEYAQEKGFSLMIVLDCGIKCHEQIDLANHYGIDVIVCDHHLSDIDKDGNEHLPAAYAVLDPKRQQCPYPFKELSGCGVGFKLIQAIAQRFNISEKKVYAFLDLVVVSIASDIVPIVGENRILAYWGLQLINKRPRRGIESILSCSHIQRSSKFDQPKKGTLFTQLIKINDLVFNVGPRINAAGRMDTGRSSVHLLINEKKDKAEELGARIDEHNKDRKELDSKITIEAMEIIQADKSFSEHRSIVVYQPDWSKGVIGIVASRLVEHFYKPTIVMSLSNDLITGSARSVQGFDLYGALCQCSHLLEHFGGHTYAAGLSLKPEHLEEFIQTFENAVASSIQETSMIPTIDIDEEISLDEISREYNEVLKRFEPFGPENPSPIFITKNVLADSCRIVGKNHLKIKVFQLDRRSFPFEAIAFDMGKYYERIRKGEPFHICYHIEENEWKNRSTLQLMIKDIKFGFAPFDQI